MNKHLCPTCFHHFWVDESKMGTVVPCPKCGLTMDIANCLIAEQPKLGTDTPYSQKSTSNVSTDSANYKTGKAPDGWSPTSGNLIPLLFMFGFLGFVFLLTRFETTLPRQPNQTQPEIKKFTTLDQNTWGNKSDAQTRLASDPTRRHGQIDWVLVEKARSSWQEGNFRSAVREDQIAAMIVILAGINSAIPDDLDREATNDYIQRNIGSW